MSLVDLVAVVVVAVSIVLLAGWIGYLVENPIPLGYKVSHVAVILLYAVGVTGLFLCYKSVQFVDEPRRAYNYLILGLLAFFVAYLTVEALF